MRTAAPPDHARRARALGRNMRQARKGACRDQAGICIALNLSQAAYSRYETGDTIPSAVRLVDIARELRVPVAQLLEGV